MWPGGLLWRVGFGFVAEIRANRFERADLDGSGGLDADELQSVYDKTGRGSTLIDNFGAIDENGDGELSADEISAYRDINTTA